MKHLEDFDQKFTLTSKNMENVIGSAGPTTQTGPAISTCENNCGDTEKCVTDDNGNFLKTIRTTYDVNC